MKYIIFKIDAAQPFEVPIIFPNNLVHAEVSVSMQQCLYRHFKTDCQVVSAGDISMFGDCSGGSDTLHIESRGAVDSRIISMYDYLHGIL